LTVFDGVSVTIDATSGGFQTDHIVAWRNGAITVDGVAADFSSVTDLTGTVVTLLNGGTIDTGGTPLP
jgi:hypothetical protein